MARRAVTTAAAVVLTVTTVVVGLVLFPARRADAINLAEWVPGLTLSPFVSERAEYQTNIFQVRSGAQADLISKTVPGLLAEWRTGPVTVSGGYRTEILRFLERSNQNTEHHIAVGQFGYEGPRLIVGLRDDFTKTTDPPGTELTGRIESTTNTMTPEIEYRVTDRFSVGANYAWTHVNFQSDVDQLDRDEHLFGTSVFWKILPKSDLRFSYAYGVKEFGSAEERDVTRHIATVGLRGELTSKLSSTFRLGYEQRTPTRAGFKAFSGIVSGGDWVYKPTERTTIVLLTDRSAQESTFGTSLFFISTTATLVANHQFLPKFGADARITAGLNDYPTKGTVGDETKFRKDYLLGWGAGVEYEIQKWLRLGAEYSHTRRYSNFDAFQFKDDKFTGRVTLQF